MYRRSLFFFRRDLRLEDNTGLREAAQASAEVIPAFCLDSRQIQPHPYRSEAGLYFLLASLEELNQQLEREGSHLFLWSGVIEKILPHILKETNAEAVFVNTDYTPFSRARDARTEDICKKNNVVFHATHDALLHPPGTVLKDDGKPYTVYTPFMKKSRTLPVSEPAMTLKTLFCPKKFATETSLQPLKDSLPEAFTDLAYHGGRAEALSLLKKATTLTDYVTVRNIPSIPGTTGLSAHHKFGTISIRETYHTVARALGVGHTLINELYWRDFFTHIAWFFPHVFEGAFHEEYNVLPWEKNGDHFKRWCNGTTGYPLVDAGMRELNATGYMHNRVRMVTASFLVKDLHIDWRKGEKYFATKLVDYDPAVNNGNWQWAASTGCDAQPYFRIFNPWLQQETYDPNCLYIKKWIPELAPLSSKEIHELKKGKTLFSSVSYPTPIVDHKTASTRAKAMYSRIKH